VIRGLIVAHAESVWMRRARVVADYGRFLVLGLALGGAVDLAVRWVVG
jgi:hypothetical protein